jgi:hypothetical protein
MLATTLTNKDHSYEIGQEPSWSRYIPSPLFLLMAIDNGWKVARVELAPSQDQLGLVYHVTLKSDSFQPDQKIILPTNALVKKILAEHSQMAVLAQADSLI